MSIEMTVSEIAEILAVRLNEFNKVFKQIPE